MTLDLDALCDDFEKRLERGERPSIREWAKSDAAIPELAALELHHRLSAGDVVTARDYFEQYPEILGNHEAAIRLVGVEYRAAMSRDSSLSEQHFRERYPDLANAQEWSNGPWVGDTVSTTGTGTRVYSPSLNSVEVPPSADLPAYVASLVQPPFPEHTNDLGRLGDYRILSILGRGGMGVVLKGANVHSGHPAAIKVMISNELALGRERFLREARAAQKIDHPRVVPIYHVGEDSGVPYIAMKMLEGQSLKDRLNAEPRLTMHEIVRIGKEIAEGLEAAHKLKLVHRDLKPDNIWLETTADDEHVRILDFGLARPIGDAEIEGVESFTKTGALAGTLAYMSPEQADGVSVNARTDLWSLGVVLYRLATRTYPFGNEPMMKVLKSIANDTPKPLHEVNPDVPIRLSKLVAKLLEKNCDDRPADANEVIRELDRVWDADIGETTVTHVVTRDEKKRTPIGHGRFLSCAVTLTVSLALLVGVGLMVSDFGEERSGIAIKPPEGGTQKQTGAIAATKDNFPELSVRSTDYLIQGMKFTAASRYAEAIDPFKKSLDSQITLSGMDHPEVAATKHLLARAMEGVKRYEEARVLHQEALDLRRKLFGENNFATAESNDYLANNLNLQNKPSEAVVFEKKADTARQAYAATFLNQRKSDVMENSLGTKFICLHHYANMTPGKPIPEVMARGILGTDSFETTFGDLLRVEAQLTKPAYCYLVVFRPDGVAECIYPEPEDADKPPELTERPRYPSKSRGDYYGLTDGTGLWVFGVVASSKPLPAYTKAIAGKTPPKLAGGTSPANTVIWDDGKWLETLTKGGTDRGTRGAGAKVQGPGAVTEAADWLKKLTNAPDAVAATIGFVVRPRN